MKIDPKDIDYMHVYRLLMSTVVPRCIGLVSTIGEKGFNLAPFAPFGIMCFKPSLVYICCGRDRHGKKRDTLVNIEYSKDFVINLVNEDLAEAVRISAARYPIGVDEFEVAGLTPVKADIVKSPMLAESPVNMECQLKEILEFGDLPRRTGVVIAEVVRFHIKEGLYSNGEIQISALKPIAKLGRDRYCRITNIFEMKVPSVS